MYDMVQLFSTRKRESGSGRIRVKVQSEDQTCQEKKKEKPADPKELKLRYVEIT